MPKPCKQTGRREESDASSEEFLAEGDEETERVLNRSSRAAQTARDLTNALGDCVVRLVLPRIESSVVFSQCDLSGYCEVSRFARNDTCKNGIGRSI